MRFQDNDVERLLGPLAAFQKVTGGRPGCSTIARWCDQVGVPPGRTARTVTKILRIRQDSKCQ